MDEQTDLTVRAAVNHTDTMATSKNIAANGRLFSALVCVANIYAGHPRLAIVAAVPIGLSAIADQLPNGRARTGFALAIYALAAVVAVFSLIQG